MSQVARVDCRSQILQIVFLEWVGIPYFSSLPITVYICVYSIVRRHLLVYAGFTSEVLMQNWHLEIPKRTMTVEIWLLQT